METITSTNFTDKISSDKIVLIDFSAEWCGPCKRMLPTLEALTQEMPEIDFYKVDVDRSPDIAEKYGIRGVPAIVIFEHGKPIARHVGALPKNTLKETLTKLIQPQQAI